MNIMTASREYQSRPKDERYPSVEAMVEQARINRTHSVERAYNLKELSAVVNDDAVLLQSPKGQARFTHWSFGQLARTVGAPANYLRDLSPGLTAACLNEGLRATPPGTTANLLVKANGGLPVVRAATSEKYGRVWDEQLYGGILNTFKGRQWSLPPTWDGQPAGANMGDRDSFLVYTDGGSIVQDASRRNNGELYRGILVRNSEVGAAAVAIDGILFQYICGNHIIWGAVVDRRFRRRHVGENALRDTLREVGTMAVRWSERSASQDEQLIRMLADNELASTEAGIVDELRTIGLSKGDAIAAYKVAEQHEANPRSYWGISAGITRMSQESGYQDERYQLDQLAMSVLKRGRERVAA